MAVETLSEFPASFVAGDTIRVTISDSDFPSTAWGLKVLLQSSSASKPFAATAVGGGSTAFSLVIAAVDSAKIPSGFYVVSYRYTQTAGGEIQTGEDQFAITVYSNPEGATTKTIARQTLEAMEAALLKLSSGSNVSVNFNGQGFTKRNIAELQKVIELQRSIVNSEDQSRTGHRRIARILHPL
jgi:hypothetical protein